MLLDSLYTQLESLQRATPLKTNSKLSHSALDVSVSKTEPTNVSHREPEQEIDKGLKEIFLFYTR